MIFHLDFRVGFDPEYRGIAMTGDKVEADRLPIRKHKGYDGGAVSCDIIFSSGLYVPWKVFIELYESLVRQSTTGVLYGKKSIRTLVQEIQ